MGLHSGSEGRRIGIKLSPVTQQLKTSWSYISKEHDRKVTSPTCKTHQSGELRLDSPVSVINYNHQYRGLF